MLVIRATQMDTLAHASANGSAVQPCPLKQTWIEIELLGEDDKPIAGARYRVLCPGGAVAEGKLDGDGLARVEGVDPGTCQITFPDLDRRAWERIA